MISRLLLAVHTDWSSYYDGEPSNKNVSQTFTDIFYIKSQNPDSKVILCSFISCTSGAIQIIGTRAYISTSFFNNCSKSTSHGGSIYMQNGEIIIEKVCSTYSRLYTTTTYSGHFGFLRPKTTPPYKSYVIQSTIFSSGTEAIAGKPSSTIHFYQGEPKVSYSNLTDGKALQTPGFLCQLINALVIKVTYNNFKDNQHVSSSLIDFNSGQLYNIMNRCNFINNSMTSNNYMNTLISLEGTINQSVSYCSFINNTNIPTIIRNSNSYSVVDHIYMDKEYTISGKPGMKITDNITLPFTNRIMHLDLASCQHEFGFEYIEEKKCKVKHVECVESPNYFALMADILAYV